MTLLFLLTGVRVRSVSTEDLRLSDKNPLAMPAVGAYGLRILSPSILELTLITTKAASPSRVRDWDFVATDFQLNAPGADQFTVTAGGSTLSVLEVGFKRRPLYAPLNKRDLRIESCLYLQLAAPIPERQWVEVKNPSGQLWPATLEFKAEHAPSRWSPVLHVNQAGYLPSGPKKAMAGYYLGSLGELPIPFEEGFQLVDGSGVVVYRGTLKRRQDKGFTYEPAPYREVWEADFSEFEIPGEYRLQVPGLGTSFPFLITEGAMAAFARTYALGIYHQRCGARLGLPFTRHGHEVCHAAPVQVPDMTFQAVNNALERMTRDSEQHQLTYPLKNCDSSLYPFVEVTDQPILGGHHDAGDYSRYTINSAGFIHALLFAVDALPGVAKLDNLGLPESGDGQSDVLQEAKWEADFLARMQDTDGGFYFLVYPRDRAYENDVLPDQGDRQVVFPKTTAVTAAAVAALAEAGSSPTMLQQFPVEAAHYLEKAERGWQFLQKAMAKYGKAGAYQKITHYGNEFAHDDELAWAASALFAATGKQEFHEQLKAWYDPTDPNTRRWTWWRLFEGYGCATRTYAFAARSGRLPAKMLDPAYLAKCETEILAAAEDHVRFARENAYGTSFPDLNKAYRTAGWYFSSERAFDITVAYQLNPRADFMEAVISNVNFEGGSNPLNMTYLTGIGWRRQREIVHQYALNDHRVLPPSGLPLGNIQAGYQVLMSYGADLEAVTYPSDNGSAAPFPYYDRWTDTFNTATEFVITDQARSLASLCFWMAQTEVGAQSWKPVSGQIAGLPLEIPAEEPVTAAFIAPGIDLTHARVIWEVRDLEPIIGNPVTFAARSAGDQWVEVEALLPDGRRIVATGTFLATTSLKAAPNSYRSAPLTIHPDRIALYHLDGNLEDATGRLGHLALSGNAKLDRSNLGWMAQRGGSSLRFSDLGDEATIRFPSAEFAVGADTTAIRLEAMVYIDELVAYNRAAAPIVSLDNGWDAYLELGEDKYLGAYIRGGTQLELIGGNLSTVLTPKEWHHLAVQIDGVGYTVQVDGAVLATLASDQLRNWGKAATVQLQLGNFAGWIDEVTIERSRVGAAPVSPDSGSQAAVAIPVLVSDGRIRLQLAGEPSRQYLLEGSSNLFDWAPISTNTLVGSKAEVDLAVGEAPWGFYRLRDLTPPQPQ